MTTAESEKICDLPLLDHIHVVLVDTANSLNIGSVARAMMNLGFRHLHLVKPRNFIEAKAKATACWASSLVDQAIFHEDLESALQDMQDVVGFTARHGKFRPAHVFLPEWIDELRETSLRNTALVFGSEDYCLSAEHVEQCRVLVRIPSRAENPAFNLAQSTLLALYEVSRLANENHAHLHLPDPETPSWNEFFQLDQKIERICDRTGFYRVGSPDPIPRLVKNLIRRMKPDAREMRVLLGMFSKIESTFDRAGVVQASEISPEEVEKAVGNGEE